MTSSAHFLSTYSDLSSADSNTDGPYFHAVNPWLYTILWSLFWYNFTDEVTSFIQYMQSKNSTAFFQVKVLHYFTQRSENLSLLKTASDLHYNQEIISLNKFSKFEIVYTSLLDHHGRGICVTKGQLFTKHQCLRYSKVTDYKNRLKLSISSRLLKLYG